MSYIEKKTVIITLISAIGLLKKINLSNDNVNIIGDDISHNNSSGNNSSNNNGQDNIKYEYHRWS